MASDKKEKKEKKKDKEVKLSADDGGKIKKEKKEKKKDKKNKAKLTAALDAHLQSDVAEQAGDVKVKKTHAKTSVKAIIDVPAVLVPFAVPLAGTKDQKKVIRMVRRAAKAGVLKRGVKEVVKYLRKSAPSTPSNRAFDGVVVIAGDISPPDVISHLPVLCEDHNVPYVFIPRRAELGQAARTKRATSVVMVMEMAETRSKGADGKMVRSREPVKEDKDKDGEGDGEAAAEGDDDDGYPEAYAALVKIVQKETAAQAHWVTG